MRILMICLIVAGLSSTAFCFGDPKHSKVEVAQSKGKDGKAEFQFKIVPNEKLQVTLDAPWKLVVSNPKDVTFANATLKKSEMDDKLPGFKISSTQAADKGSFDYKMTSFVCTKDKTTCYREVHKGSHSW